MKELKKQMTKHLIVYTIILLINIAFLWFYKYNRGFNGVMLFVFLLDIFFNLKYIFGKDIPIVVFLVIASLFVFGFTFDAVVIALVIFTIIDYLKTLYLYIKTQKQLKD